MWRAAAAGLLGSARRGLARLLPELDPDTAAALPSDGVQAAQLLELVLGLIGRLSAARPVMLVLEDLHWADQSTLELLAFLVRSLRDMPVLLVATYRSDELHRRHPLLTGWERVRSVHRIELPRFERDEVAAQLDAILARESGPELIDLVCDRSGGNAFLVEELAGVVRAGGDPADLPPSLRDVLLSRIDTLDAAAQLLLRTASAGGLALDLDAPTIALRGYVNLSDVLEFLGHHAEAADAATDGLALAARVGLTRTFGSSHRQPGRAAAAPRPLGGGRPADRQCAESAPGGHLRRPAAAAR